MPLAPVLTSPWMGVEHGGAGRGLGDLVRGRLRAQLDTSFQMLRNARDCGISVMSGSDTGNAPMPDLTGDRATRTPQCNERPLGLWPVARRER